ncbi:MAG: glucose-1-phosphate adenylyltransferase [Planctomycetaceae bacterium]|nr:glucose-1-phosphate adenylyltransferase [Planctomycetaceae bacterium]
MQDVLALVLAGGRGTRLEPLTRDRAKPAVPFGGAYRIIDFTLSNCINSGLRRMIVLTQYKAASLDRHLRFGWNFLSRELNEFIEVLPPQQRLNDHWYQGTADAVYQNIYTIEKHPSEQLLILSGDHIYKMDYAEMLEDHRESGADATVACLPVLLDQASQFGVLKIDDDRRIVDFQEKPNEAAPSPDDPLRCLASMGVYVFNTRFLFEELCRDATVPGSAHDFGKNIIPSLIHKADVRAFPFRDKNTGEGYYWRDVGTLDSYYEANQDLVSVEPELNLYDLSWPIRTYQPSLPPPKFVFAQQAGPNPRRGVALDSMVCDGSILSGGKVERSIIGHGVKVSSWSTVEDSILFDGVQVGREVQIRRAIIDKHVEISPGTRIGFDPDEDRRNGYTVTESGITVIPRSIRQANPNLLPFAGTG